MKDKYTDKSGDRKYFTTIPNMIVNHSTHYEQSLYLVMKRIAGEHGTCFASQNTVAQMMGVRKRTVAENIKKLLKRNWIREIEPIKVKGGNVRQFEIVDLWKLNIQEYESGSQKRRVSKVGPKSNKVGPKRHQSGSQTSTKKKYEEEDKKSDFYEKIKEGDKETRELIRKIR